MNQLSIAPPRLIFSQKNMFCLIFLIVTCWRLFPPILLRFQKSAFLPPPPPSIARGTRAKQKLQFFKKNAQINEFFQYHYFVATQMQNLFVIEILFTLTTLTNHSPSLARNHAKTLKLNKNTSSIFKNSQMNSTNHVQHLCILMNCAIQSLGGGICAARAHRNSYRRLPVMGCSTPSQNASSGEQILGYKTYVHIPLSWPFFRLQR